MRTGPIEGYSDVCEAGYKVRWIKKVSCKAQQQIIEKRALTSGGLAVIERNIVSAPGTMF